MSFEHKFFNQNQKFMWRRTRKKPSKDRVCRITRVKKLILKANLNKNNPKYAF